VNIVELKCQLATRAASLENLGRTGIETFIEPDVEMVDLTSSDGNEDAEEGSDEGAAEEQTDEADDETFDLHARPGRTRTTTTTNTGK
jgi:hypothetical protein